MKMEIPSLIYGTTARGSEGTWSGCKQHFLDMLFKSFFLCISCLSSDAALLYSHGHPTPDEQYMLELVNRARADPKQKGIFLDTLDMPYANYAKDNYRSFFTNLIGEFASYPPVAPLAFNEHLINAARKHAVDMLQRNYFAHKNPEGQWPPDRAKAEGYQSSYVGENISGGADVLEAHFGLMVDYNNLSAATHPLGHRLNCLNKTYSEVGIGIVQTKLVQDFGDAGLIFLLGVVYVDTNGDGFYTPGEGLAGVRITPSDGNYYAVTSESGGYAIPVEAVETNTNVNVPLTVLGANGWSDDIAQQEDAFRKAYSLTNTATKTITITASGGLLRTPITKTISIVSPVTVQYHLTGTDGWYFARTYTVRGGNTKVDFVATDLFTPCVLAIQRIGQTLSLSWSGGNPPYRVQTSSSMLVATWQDIGAVRESTTMEVPLGGDTTFYRVLWRSPN